jgi:high-affinity iron transporter
VLGSFLVMLREGFEATLLVAIVLAYLAKTGHREGFRGVWLGVGAALLVSLGAAGALFLTASELGGTAAALFKVATMWLAVGFLTYMVLWMRRQSRTVAQGIRKGVDGALAKGSAFALAGLVFVMVLREGLETGLFMFGLSQASSPAGVLVGGIAGTLGAVLLGYLVYAGGRRIDLGAFFKITGVLLVVVAAGLLARGVAILEIEGFIPAFFYPLWDATRVVALGSGSVIGQSLTAFLGWDPKPDLLEFVAWAAYLFGVGYVFLRPTATPQPRAAGARG